VSEETAGGEEIRVGILGRPRPMPRRLLPALGGSIVILLALPVFLVAHWPLAGWALGIVLYLAGQALGLLLTRLRVGVDSVASSGVVGFAMMFRSIAVMVVAIAVAAGNARVGIAAAVLYALAYTMELGLSVVLYFSGAPRT
jgi:hypothetical protein